MTQENLATKMDVNAIIEKWKNVSGSLVMMLHSVQDQYGYVPRELAMEIAQKANIPLARIYEVLTFYHFFKLTPPAKYQVAVCTGTACYLKGAPDLLKEIENVIGIKEGEHSLDGKYSVNSVRCIGCCGLAPVVSVNGKIYGQVKPADIKSILRESTKGEEHHG
ncbi:MAG: NAD(P)H-dependent oxidoreductase subunit E [Elusimicrobiota bacterium]|jgi:NADH-quinone oxidoreductase subunit E|nr:NAD(P)H-dependent oxidoreductase subunit E [Elusimicrobiota bacterium]